MPVCSAICSLSACTTAVWPLACRRSHLRDVRWCLRSSRCSRNGCFRNALSSSELTESLRFNGALSDGRGLGLVTMMHSRRTARLMLLKSLHRE